MTVHVDVELTEAQKQQLEAIARHEDVLLGEVIAKLVQSRLDDEARFKAAVEEGLAQMRRGEALSNEDVIARAMARRERLRAPGNA